MTDLRSRVVGVYTEMTLNLYRIPEEGLFWYMHPEMWTRIRAEFWNTTMAGRNGPISAVRAGRLLDIPVMFDRKLRTDDLTLRYQIFDTVPLPE